MKLHELIPQIDIDKIIEDYRKEFVEKKKELLQGKGISTEGLACNGYSTEKCVVCPYYKVYCTEEEISHTFEKERRDKHG